MRKVNEIIRKFKQARYRHIQKRLRRRPRAPDECRYHKFFESSTGKTVGCCHYSDISGDDDWPVKVCDSEMPEGLAQAKKCPVFEYRVNKAEAASYIDNILLNGETGEIAFHLPDLNALLWVLGDEMKEKVLAQLRERSEDFELDAVSKSLLEPRIARDDKY